MEPMTKIELGTCKWLGLIALACSAAAELIGLAQGRGFTPSWVARESARRTAHRTRSR